MKWLLAIPVYNEERYLPRVLDAIKQYAPRVLVVNDGSTDGVADLLAARRDICRITHPENRGYGQSLIDAFRFADERGYEWVITMDCDEQHEPAQIPAFLREMERDDADIISGSRYLHCYPSDDAPPEDRRRINLTISTLLEQILGLRLTDSFCGFKAHRVSAMRALRLDVPGYAFPMQFWVEAVRAKLRVREIPVRRIYRDRGREFGGTLDDPASRLQHYLEVFVDALRREPATEAAATTKSAQCSCGE